MNPAVNEFVSISELQDKSERYYFKEALNADSENIYLSKIDLNIERGEIVKPFEPTIRMAISTGTKDGLIPGVIVINFNLRSLFDKIYSSVKKGQVFQIIKSDGAWVINSENPEMAWAGLLGVSEEGLGAELFDTMGSIERQGGVNELVRVDLPLSNFTYYVRAYLDSDYVENLQHEAIYKTLPLLGLLLLVSILWTYISVKYEMSLKALSIELSKQLTVSEQASSYKSRFLANMSHEIRTPLTAIIGLLGVVRRNPDSAILAKNLPLVEESAKNLMVLINDILDLSKVESGKMQLDIRPFCFNQVAEKSVGLFSREADIKNLEFHSLIDPRLSQISLIGDPLRIGQVINNLVGNAIKFTHIGMVKLVVQLKSDSADNAIIKVRVEDTGIGIQEESISRLYEPFEQADYSITKEYGGSGLGLSISRHLLEMMGAGLTVESEIGRGSVFSFELSLPISMMPIEESYLSTSDVPRRILLLEENFEISRSISEMLNFWGATVDVAQNTADAAEQFKASLVTDEPIRLILLSWSLVRAEFEAFREQIQNLSKDEKSAIPPKLLMMTEIQRSEAPFDQCGHNEIAIVQRPVTISRFLDALYSIGLVSMVTEEYEQDELDTLQEILRVRLSQSKAPKILLAEDNTYNQILIEELFSSFGLIIDVVSNGQEAVMAVAERSYDMVFMDIQMPVMDGLAAAVEIRKQYSKELLPIIAISAASFPSDINQAMFVGMNSHLSKPIDVALLIKSIIKFWTPTILAEGISKSVAPVVEDLEKIAVRNIFASDCFSREGSILEQIDAHAYLRVAAAFVEGMDAELLIWADGAIASSRQRRTLMHKLLGSVGSIGAVSLQRAIELAWQEMDEKGDADISLVLGELRKVVSILRENLLE